MTTQDRKEVVLENMKKIKVIMDERDEAMTVAVNIFSYYMLHSSQHLPINLQKKIEDYMAYLHQGENQT